MVYRWSLLIVALILFSGCAVVPMPDAPDERLFWPHDNAPKIEYIAFYESTWDLERGVERYIEWAIFGREKALPLFSRPSNLAADDNNRVILSDVVAKTVFVMDLANHKMRNLLNGEGARYATSFPGWIAVDAAGGVYLTDPVEQKISYFGSDETFKFDFEKGFVGKPCGLVVDERRGRVFVADAKKHQVAIFDTKGKYLGQFGGRGSEPGRFNYPLDVDLDSDGNIYVLDSLNARVQVFDSDLTFVRTIGERGAAGAGFQIPKGIAVSSEGHVYVTDSLAKNIKVFDRTGSFLLTLGGYYTGPNNRNSPGGFVLPSGIAINSKGEIWVADSVTRLIQRFQYLNEEYLSKNPL